MHQFTYEYTTHHLDEAPHISGEGGIGVGGTISVGNMLVNGGDSMVSSVALSSFTTVPHHTTEGGATGSGDQHERIPSSQKKGEQCDEYDRSSGQSGLNRELLLMLELMHQVPPPSGDDVKPSCAALSWSCPPRGEEDLSPSSLSVSPRNPNTQTPAADARQGDDAFGEDDLTWLLLYGVEMGHILAGGKGEEDRQPLALDGYSIDYYRVPAIGVSEGLRSLCMRKPGVQDQPGQDPTASSTTSRSGMLSQREAAKMLLKSSVVVPSLKVNRGSTVYGCGYLLTSNAQLTEMDRVMGPAYERTLVLCRTTNPRELNAVFGRDDPNDRGPSSGVLLDGSATTLVTRELLSSQCFSADEFHKAWAYVVKMDHREEGSDPSIMPARRSGSAPSAHYMDNWKAHEHWMPQEYRVKLFSDFVNGEGPFAVPARKTSSLARVRDGVDSASPLASQRIEHVSSSSMFQIGNRSYPTASRPLPSSSSMLSQLPVDANGTVWYFAYGSNMSRAQLIRRIGIPAEQRTVKLSGYYFTINKPSMTYGLGYANIVKSPMSISSTTRNPGVSLSLSSSSSAPQTTTTPINGTSTVNAVGDDEDYSACVYGVAYRITPSQLQTMDTFEGGYDRVLVNCEEVTVDYSVTGRAVSSPNGNIIPSVAYIAPGHSLSLLLSSSSSGAKVLLPSREYMETILDGKAYLPSSYVDFLKKQPVCGGGDSST